MALARVLAGVALVWTITPAHADSDPATNAFRALAEGLRGETLPIKGPLPMIGVGWQVLDHVALAGELGFMWGTRNTGLFGETKVTHVSLAPTLGIPVEDADALTFDVAVLGGYTVFGLGTLGASVGVDARVTGGVKLGPVGKLRAGMGNLMVFALGGPLFDGEGTDALFVLGLEI